MENRIAALEKNVQRHEDVIEALRNKLDDIHASISRLEVRLNVRGEPGVSEFCRQHMLILNGFGERINKVELQLTDLRVGVNTVDKDITGVKIRLAAYLTVIVVLVNLITPWIRHLLGIP